MRRTKFTSYVIGKHDSEIPEGCKYCIKGKKLVLFISGKCSRNCFYCSLSEKRKNKDIIWANEREIKSIKELLQEAIESKATSCGITGGDPLLCFQRTLKFARALKKKFGKRFHIHIYLPTKLITKEKLGKLSKYIDEIRLHPEFLIKNLDNNEINKEIEKIKLANLFFKKQNIGIELPLLPNKKQNIIDFIKKTQDYIGFVNLNEFEISDTNFNYVQKNHKLNQDTYTIKNSIKTGIEIIKILEKTKPKLKINIHLCTAAAKNLYQYRNRLKRHKILPFGKKTKEGLVIYFAIYAKDKEELNEIIKDFNNLKLKEYYADNKKNRIILSPEVVKKLINNKINNYKIKRVEEFPTFDGIEVEKIDMRKDIVLYA